ncbi:MAG TPA: LuxR C-terminal-related transcriptional regulator [Polyangia bacterium]
MIAGQRYVPPDLGEEVLDRVSRWVRDPTASWDPLTARQCEILRLICKCLTTPEIAKTLCVSVKTVEADRAEMMRKADVRKVEGLVLYAVRTGLVVP